MSEVLPKDSDGETVNKNTAEHASYGRTKDGLIARRIIDGGPESGFIYKTESFSDSGGSPDMRVNGAVTPVEFEAGPPDGEIWFVTNLILSIGGFGDIKSVDFGSIPLGLANGLLLESVNKGVITNLDNFLINLDFGGFFVDEFEPLPFSDIDKSFRIRARFYKPIVFIGRATPALSDFFRYTVRDDLRTLSLLVSNISYRRKAF